MRVKVLYGTEDKWNWVEVEGWRTGVPGLVVTESFRLVGWYVISHLPSGRAFGSYVWPSIAAAKRAAKKSGEFEDWEDHQGQRNSITGRLLKQVSAICKEEGLHSSDVMFGGSDE